jgi:hypothetical protein
MTEQNDSFAAAQQALGYGYQVRFGLLRMMELNEDTSLLIEKDDDLDFQDDEEGQILASLKHKAPGDTLTDLSPDFWKSVRIWLTRYVSAGKLTSQLTFFLFTTGVVTAGSFLENFVVDGLKAENLPSLADAVLLRTTSKVILKTKIDFDQLNLEEKGDFLSKITIFDHQVRIEDVPAKIKDRMRSVRHVFRDSVFERLEGWWTNVTIELMAGVRINPVYGREVSEMLSEFSDQYKKDNLPIDFRNEEPPDGVDPENDTRMFVRQLHALGLKPDRVRRSILDYYRAFTQRGSWIREQVLLNGELEEYEDRLTDEWDRFRNICFEDLDAASNEANLVSAGKKLFTWAETNNTDRVRIRPAVTEAYVSMGSFHILANEQPLPKIHWHPQFVERLDAVLSENKI